MARIAGVDLPRNKRSEIALTYIFGIGRPLAKEILGKAGISAAALLPGDATKRPMTRRSKCRAGRMAAMRARAIDRTSFIANPPVSTRSSACMRCSADHRSTPRQ